MRLVCPNCGAQYEVPDDVIPPEGRDVQCSSCSSTWFQEAVSAPPEPDDFDAVTKPDEDWTPDVDGGEDLVEETAAEIEEAVSPTVTMSSEATDEALAAAVKAAVARARPDHVVQQQPEEAPEEVAEVAEAPTEPDAFESDLEARLDSEIEETDAPEPEDTLPEAQEDHWDTDEASEDETLEEQADTPADTDELPRRALDPSVADVLRQEAALEASLREEETLESQPDLGLDEPDPKDENATRARQARERMARMRGVPVQAQDAEPEVIPANSRRDLLPDIDEINSTLRATEDRAPEEQPDGRATPGQRRAGGRRMGFALALLAVAAAVYVYTSSAQVSAAFPQAETYVSAFVNMIDKGRLALDGQVTHLMLWLDKIASSAGQG